MNLSVFEGVLPSVRSISAEFPLFWAANEKFGQLTEQMGQRFKPTSSTGSSFLQFLGFLVVAVLVIGIVYFLLKFFETLGDKSSGADFRAIYRKLCSAHRLTISERLLIRKVVKRLDLEYPLVLFVEPRYFQKILDQPDFEINRTMIQTVFKKIFGFTTELESVAKGEKASVVSVPKLSQAPTPLPAPFQESPSFTDVDLNPTETKMSETPESEKITIFSREKPMPSKSLSPKKVLLPLIPGSQAFSSIASTFDEVNTEIASKSIHHSLLSGRENDRTFKIHDETHHDSMEIALPLPAPEPLRSTLEEMEENDRKMKILPKSVPTKSLVPIHIQGKKRIEPPVKVLPVKHYPHVHQNHVSSGNYHYGETFTMEDVAMIEALVAKKEEK